MDVAERLLLDCDTDGALREINGILTAQDRSKSDVSNALLLSAFIHFHLGKLRQSSELLNRVQFEVFEVSQWIVENNNLVIQYLESLACEDKKTSISVIQGFSSLLEKSQGLPCIDVLPLELYISFNFALAMLLANASEASTPGGYRVAQMKLQQVIERVCQSVHSGESLQRLDQPAILDKLKYFWPSNKTKIGEEVHLPLAWSCWLLALFWLMDCRVNDAQQLIELVMHFYKADLITERKNGLIFSIMKEGINIHPNNSRAPELLTPVCHLVLCYVSFLKQDKQEALKQCNLCLSLKSESIPGLLMKGLILYETGDYCDALKPLQQVLISSTDSGYNATALNLLGCACAKLGKPHTALVKFRESFACSTDHVEALFNIGELYHELASFDLEISIWKYLLKILTQRNSSKIASMRKGANVEFITGIIARILGDVISKDQLLISTDIHCVQSCDLRNAQLSRQVILYKIAHSCFQQERYSEAAEYFVDLLALLTDKPMDLQKTSVPSMAEIFRESAEALSKSGRHEDSLIVCEKILLQRTVLSSNEMSTSKRLQRRLSEDEDDWFRTKSVVDIMLCKAEALTQLQRPVEAYGCYERIVEVINKKIGDLCDLRNGQVESDEPDHKRQKTEIGSKGVHTCDEEALTNIELEYEKLKALTFNNQALLLKSLGRKKEALLLLAQSICCHPDCIRYHYNHTCLLFDMGQDEEASRNWLKIRKIDPTEKSTITANTITESDRQSKAHLADKHPSLYIAMDSRAVRSSCKKS